MNSERILAGGLLLSFLGLVATTLSITTIALVCLLASTVALGMVVHETWTNTSGSTRLAAVAAIGGLMSTNLFAATTVHALDESDWSGVGILIPPAWLFAAIGWLTHRRNVHTFRWMATLVQLPFTALSSALFAVLAVREDGTVGRSGFTLAAVVGLCALAAGVSAALLRLAALRGQMTGTHANGRTRRPGRSAD